MKNYLVLFFFLIWVYSCTQTQHNIPIFASKQAVYIPVTIGDTTVQMLWDTGADVTVLSQALADKLGIEYDTTKLSQLTLFSSHFGDRRVPLKRDTIPVYQGNKILSIIGKYPYLLRPLIVPGLNSNLCVLGTDFMHDFYYAVHLTDNKLSLSNTPLSFADLEITDSVVFKLNTKYGKRPICKSKIDSDSLELLLDSGMDMGLYLGNDNFGTRYDIVLEDCDTISETFKVFSRIESKPTVKMNYRMRENEFNIVHDSIFKFDSFSMQAYILFVRSKNHELRYNGYVTYGLISRFDIFYYDPEDRVAKLYKIKDYASLSGDVPFSEFKKRSKVIGK